MTTGCRLQSRKVMKYNSLGQRYKQRIQHYYLWTNTSRLDPRLSTNADINLLLGQGILARYDYHGISIHARLPHFADSGIRDLNRGQDGGSA